MGKHINYKTKYHYVMRYLNGESPTKLGMEVNSFLRSPDQLIYNWASKYNKHGIEGLKSKTGKKKGPGKGRPKKEKKPNYEDMTREELLKHIKIKDYYIDEINKRTSSTQRFPLVDEIVYKYKITIKLACAILKISRSGYYAWVKNGRAKYGKYDGNLLKLILEVFKSHNGTYGAERIMGELIAKHNIKRNIKTIRRYMNKLDIKSKIRNPRKRSKFKKEIKDTVDLRKNYINGNFKQDTNRVKTFTDTTEWKMPSNKIYISDVVGANSNLYSINFSYRNNKRLILKDIEEGIRKIGKKFYIQFDNASFYKGKDMNELLSRYKGIASFGKAGESKANWPIENFWSILKQEYLNIYRPKNIQELKRVLFIAYFDYNHNRIQKKLKWKTPAQARV